MANQDIKTAVEALAAKATRITKYERYYDGDHDLKYATQKYQDTFKGLFKEFALNLCPAICDALSDNLKVVNFSVEENAQGGDDLVKEAWMIWQKNLMGVRAGQIHTEASKTGDGYAMVWVDSEQKVTIYPNRSSTCTVIYDEETPGKILFAAKYWHVQDKKIRLNLFYPDRIEKYITKNKAESLPKEDEFQPYNDDGKEVINNPYGIVPVFHFPNNGDISGAGRSELINAIPIQDALNKTVLDELVSQEFSAYRQRYATGIEPELDEQGKVIPAFSSGSGKLWITGGPER